MKNRILSMALVCLMLLALVPAAFAAGTTKVELFEVTDGTGFKLEWSFPSCIGYAGTIQTLDGTDEPIVILLDSEEETVNISFKIVSGLDAVTSVRLGDCLNYFGNDGVFAYDGKFFSEDGTFSNKTYTFPALTGGTMSTLIVEFVNADSTSPGWAGWSSIMVLTPSDADDALATGKFKGVDVPGLKELITAARTSGTAPAPTPAPAPQTVNPTSSVVYVNGAETAFDAYNIGGNNFFKLRDLAQALNGSGKQFEIGYNSETKAITLTSGSPYTAVGGELVKGDGKAKAASLTASKVYLDGTELNLTAYIIGGNNFFKLRDLMQALDVYVGYDNTTKAITLDTSRGYVAE